MIDHAGEDPSAADEDFEWVNAWAVAATRPQAHADGVTAPVEGRKSPVVPLFEVAPRQSRKRWTSLLRLVAPANDMEAAADDRLFLLDPHPAGTAERRDEMSVTGVTSCREAVLDVGLIERDVAEIELARDRLLAEPVPARRSSPAGRAAERTSDHVPVIVGGLLAFASIVVFAAAASLVSLR